MLRNIVISDSVIPTLLKANKATSRKSDFACFEPTHFRPTDYPLFLAFLQTGIDQITALSTLIFQRPLALHFLPCYLCACFLAPTRAMKAIASITHIFPVCPSLEPHNRKRHPAPKSTIARFIRNLITRAYATKHKPPPVLLHAHSARSEEIPTPDLLFIFSQSSIRRVSFLMKKQFSITRLFDLYFLLGLLAPFSLPSYCTPLNSLLAEVPWCRNKLVKDSVALIL